MVLVDAGTLVALLALDTRDARRAIRERERIERLFALDRRDFELYRPHRVGRFRITP